MYHSLRLYLTGGEHSKGFRCDWQARGTVDDPNAMQDIARGLVGTVWPITVFSYGRIKVTIELLPDVAERKS